MALREVEVEVRATYIIKVKAGSDMEARHKAEDWVCWGITPDYMDSAIVNVEPIKNNIKGEINYDNYTRKAD